MSRITIATSVAQKSAALIDNILINHCEYKFVSGNITSLISDENLLSPKTLKKKISPKMTTKLCSGISKISIRMPLKETLVQ